MGHSSRYKQGERFGAIPVELMESDAWHWLPLFARVSVLALAAGYWGTNNGGIELPDKRAADLGLSRQDKNVGLRLAARVGIVRQTVKARRRSGRGIPAKYAITWKKLDHFENLGFCATEKPSNDWINADIPAEPIKSRRAAERFLGWKTSTGSLRAAGQTLEGGHHERSEKDGIEVARVARKSGFQASRATRSKSHVRPEAIEIPLIPLSRIRAQRMIANGP